MKYVLRCSRCGSVETREPAYKCACCGHILTFEYALEPDDFRPDARGKGIFRYARVLPIDDQWRQSSLGEGNTPLVESLRVGREHGLQNVFFKLDSLNPTGSFKDRASALMVGCALRYGCEKIIIASSGNASASVAAYAARYGLKLVAVVPEQTPDGKVLQARAHGAEIIRVPGNYSNSFALCRRMAAENGWYDATTTFINPYAREGYKTLGYEIFEQLGRACPDYVVLPTGAGPILAAVYQAFVELKRMRQVEKIPRLVCVQAANCGPIAQAFINGADGVEACANPLPTLASGINDSLNGYADDGDFTLKCVRASGGCAIALSEGEIRESMALMASEGIFAEPAGAVSAIAIQRLAQVGAISKKDRVVGVVTGHGLKVADAYGRHQETEA